MDGYTRHSQSEGSRSQTSLGSTSGSGTMRRPRPDTDDTQPNGRGDPEWQASRRISEPLNYQADGSDSLPTAWLISDTALRHGDPLCIIMSSTPRTTVYSNGSVPGALFGDALSRGRSSWRRQNEDSSSLYPNLADDESPQHSNFSSPCLNPNATSVYYFEVTVICDHPKTSVDVSVGLFFEKDTFGAWPGELPNSIGWGTEGLYINGRRFGANPNPIRFRNGDVLGCGIETGGMNRVFFTLNGTMTAAPSPNTAFPSVMNSGCYPVVSFRHGAGDILMGNFGMDDRVPLLWTGTDRLTVIPQQSGRSIFTRSLDSLPSSESSSVFRQQGDKSSRSRSPSPYYGLSELDRMEPSRQTKVPVSSEAVQKTSVNRLPASGLVKPAAEPRYGIMPPQVHIEPPSPMANLTQSYFGTRNNLKSLVDDDPSTTNAITSEHLRLASSNSSHPLHSTSDMPSWSAHNPGTPHRMQSSPAYRDSQQDVRQPRRAASGSGAIDSRRQSRREEHRAARRARNSAADPVSASLTESSHSRQCPTERRVERRAARMAGNSLSTSLTGSSHRAESYISEPGLSTSMTGSFHGAESHTMEPGLSATLTGSSHTVESQAMEPMSPATKPSVLPTTSETDSGEHSQGSSLYKSPRRESTSRPGAVAAEASDDIGFAKENSDTLRAAARKKEIDPRFVKDLLEVCKRDQERLQRKLNNALEEADAIDNLEELFALNDGICSAIEAADEVLKREKENSSKKNSSKKKKALEGPTIGVLVENEDVFSLICMLRAPNEKRFTAALALMKFARENEMLRNEIRSSGGMHSFLTLFRTTGMGHDLRVVSSLAVAYVLPSFVASSQTAPSVGLKIVECLRFLAISQSIAPQNVAITRVEMLKAASMGVNVLWINAIQPLLALEAVKNESSRESRPALRPSASMRFGRLRGRAGGGVFDQGQESIEIQELAELAVILVAHLAKITDSGECQLDMGYNIVEQVCEVDAARPIAVREGLLRILVGWIRSKDVDRVRPAASALRYLISIEDKYMAGWIHSQVVNEGAVGEIVKLLNVSVGHDVRVAIAQMLSALCVAPHTRAAVIEAKCVSYLVALLYEHTHPSSEEMVHFAASALLQLAAGAMIKTSSGTNLAASDTPSSDKQETVVNELIEGWAHGSFVQIALEHEGKLRSVSVEALRVLSEDTNTSRRTRLQLCSVGAAEALGKTLKDDLQLIQPLKNPEHFGSMFLDSDSGLVSAVNDVHEALRCLANILEPQKEGSRSDDRRLSQAHVLTPQELLIKGCLDVVKSGGFESLIWIASLPCSQTPLSDNLMVFSADRMDLLDEACRLLANLSPLLLCDAAAAKGCAKWASDVFRALDGMLSRLVDKNDGTISDGTTELNVDALRGLGALARYEPLKIRIVDKSLAKLLFFKSMSGERNEVSNAASQVLLSLGFTEDEIAVQVAGNNPKLLVDWFCLQRALLVQAMVRAEMRSTLGGIWELPFSDTDVATPMGLMRQLSVQSNLSSGSCDERSADSSDPIMQGLFENFTYDRDSAGSRDSVLRQYQYVYERDLPTESTSRIDTAPQSGISDSESLLSPQVYPLNDISVEKEWVLSHRRAINSTDNSTGLCAVGIMPERIEKLLDCCFPSKLLRNDVLPVNDLRPQSSFNFRALMMPQRRYFSFRREGQLLGRLCEKQAAVVDTDDVHWTLAFTNSTFAGEFVESLVQTLYLCPMITGLSFARNPDWLAIRDTESESDGDDGGGLLANLSGSLPPWVSHLTFDNMLSDRDLKALVVILDTMGKLSSGGEESDEAMFHNPSLGQSQGKFSCVSIRNSHQVSRDSWISFFKMLGKSGPAKGGPVSTPLSTLKVLDLSGNKLGDEAAAMVLELVHDKDSGCNLEQLDLSGNRIGRGINVVRVLRSYTEYYRYNQKLGVKMVRSSWKSSLHSLVLAENDLFLGQAGLEILALLKHNALCLRYLDLANNSLEGDTYQLLASTLLKNTSLCHLNLSGNKFSSPLIDLILDHINAEDAESGLSFLVLERNEPQLNEVQRQRLGAFLRKSRKNAIERFMKDKERGVFDESNETGDTAGDLELIDESTSHNIFRASFSQPHQQLSHPEVAEPVQDEFEDNMITVLFSAPLVFADADSRLHPFAKLDFDMERELLWQCMKEASRDIELSFDNAHHSRLLATLTKRCSCLHYSGHGHPNFLPFEDGMGGPNWFNVQDIKELIVRNGVAPFKFVFVSACHSGLAGDTFASAGVPHVVCCKQESELKDTAALAFTRSFYLALAMGQTVQESFEQGCKAVRATPNLNDPDKEMEKFVLLPKDGNHDVPVFRAKPVREWPRQPRNHQMVSSRSRRRGSSLLRMRSVIGLGAKSSELSTRNMMQEDPSPTAPQFFLGREVDMYYILTALLKMRKRLVTVLGETGIGRSSVVCALCHYINERASTITEIERIYFIRRRQGGRNLSCRSLLRQLVDKMEEAGACGPTNQDADTESMLDTIARNLKNEKALIVFDRTELLETSDESQEFPMILSTLLYETKQVKVILTAKHPLGQPSIGGQVEHPFNLGPLNFANSVRLFSNLCPHLHTPSERGLLVTKLVNDCRDQADLFPGDAAMSKRSNAIMALVGDGVPAKIEKAAYSISKEGLAKLLEGGV